MNPIEPTTDLGVEPLFGAWAVTDSLCRLEPACPACDPRLKGEGCPEEPRSAGKRCRVSAGPRTVESLTGLLKRDGQKGVGHTGQIVEKLLGPASWGVAGERGMTSFFGLASRRKTCYSVRAVWSCNSDEYRQRFRSTFQLLSACVARGFTAVVGSPPPLPFSQIAESSE